MSGITFAQVSAVADQLVSEGSEVSINIIRAKLGTGSPNTVQKHLKAWREKSPQPCAVSVAISPSLNNALVNELISIAAASRAEVERKLIQAEADVAALSQGGDLLEQERDELKQRLLEMTTDRDTILGKATQQEVDVAMLSERLEREQSERSNVQVQLAMEKLKLTDLQKRDVDQEAEIQRQADLIQVEAKARITAEQIAAVLATKLEHSVALTAKAEASTATLSKQLADTTSELQAARSQMQILQNEHSALSQKLHRSQLETQEAVGAAKQADRAAAELRGRLDALLERSKEDQTRESASAAKQADRVDATEYRDPQAPMRERSLEGLTLK